MEAISSAVHARGRRWNFSEMRPQDLRQVLEIERSSFDNPWTSALFLQELRIPFSRILVARPAGRDEAIAGYLCRWFVADEIHVLNVAVHPRYRRLGLGAVLLQEAMREAQSGRAEAVTLEVRRSNEAAQRLYASFGFEEVGVRRNYYGRGEDALIMRLPLRRG